jgi:4-hydroxythreonine-4-phosphate dehydrogenase
MGSRSLIITQGDPAGVGPELLCAVAAAGALRTGDEVVAATGPLDRVAREVDADWARKGRAALEPYLTHPPDSDPEDFGQYAALVYGVDRALRDPERFGLVTAPIEKKIAQREGLEHPGHTEYLAARAGVEDFAMAMLGPSLRVVLATIHLPLSAVPGALTHEGIVRAGDLLLRALVDDYGIAHPRLAVLGLNPHAGEGGVLGREDIELIAPAVKALASMHPVMHFDDGVNRTLGLPFVRTSPDHGTAKDIAFTGKVNPASMLAAVEMARGQH